MININNNINIELFKLIKSHKKEEFINLINKNPNLNLNIKDNSNNYLIQYAILYNYTNIVKLLLSKSIKIDIYDTDQRSILYIPIKYRYNNMLKIILENEKDSIGVSLLDYGDNMGLHPLHYAIYFGNIDAVRIILEYYEDINQTDKNGNSYLHAAIKHKNRKIFDMIIEKNPNLNQQTNEGETPIHLSCNYGEFEISKLLLSKGVDINISDYQAQITPIFYSIILNNIELFNLLLA